MLISYRLSFLYFIVFVLFQNFKLNIDSLFKSFNDLKSKIDESIKGAWCLFPRNKELLDYAEKKNVEFHSISKYLVLEDCPLTGNNVVDEVVGDFVHVNKEVHDIVPFGEEISHDESELRFTQMLNDVFSGPTEKDALSKIPSISSDHSLSLPNQSSCNAWFPVRI